MPKPAHRSIVLVPCLVLLAATTGGAQDAAEPEAAPERLTIATAVELALAQNDRLLDARDGITQANNSVRAARSYFRPKVAPNILGSFGQTDISNQTYRVDLSQRFTTGTELRAGVATITQQNQLGNFYNSDTTLALVQPLLRGFGRTSRGAA